MPATLNVLARVTTVGSSPRRRSSAPAAVDIAAASKLTAGDLEMFARLGIPREMVEAAGIERVTDHQARADYGITKAGDMGGLVFPYFLPNGNGRVTCRLRRDHPEIEAGKPKNKYVYPFGDTHHLYFPAGAAALLADPNTEIVFVEGEKSALAMLAWSQRVGRKLGLVATGGCWGWRGRTGKTTDASGERVDEVGALPDLHHAQGRTAYILFDANVATNLDVQAARRQFASELRKLEAHVATLNLPEGPWNGPDDYIAANGDEAMRALFDAAAGRQVTVGTTREDTSNAERFAEQHKHVVRFWHGRNVWLLWSGRHWSDDQDAQVRELAKQTARSIYIEAAGLPEEEAKRMGRWAERSLNRDKIAAMLELAKSIPAIAISTDKLDCDPHAMNFMNGIVDLRTGELREHRRDDYMTKLVRWPYTADLVSPHWCWFLEQTFGELFDSVQKAVGYSLTGVTLEKVVFLLLGLTNTGKTTFLSTLRELFRDYSAALQISTLMWDRHEDNNASADLADLRGARFVVTSETEEGQRLREAKLKRITQGMGSIKTTRKYENPIEFAETHKLWLDANHAPIVRGSDDAIWRRLVPIPCTHRIEDANIDKDLPAKLLHEAEGIISWAVAGAVRWHEEGLGRPEAIEQERARWRESMDTLGEFLAECCVESKQESAGASELYQAYHQWAEKQGHHALSATAFGLRLFERGFNKGQETTGKRRVTYFGLRLRDPFEPEEQ